MTKQVVDSLKVISEITMLEAFDRNNFKRWKERVLPILEFTKIERVLYELKLDDDPRNKEKWERTNKLCVHAIKCGFSNKFFDNYCHFTCAKDLWDELNGHYGFEDEGAKKFVIAKFMYFQMVEQKSISRQIEDFKKLVSNLAKEGDFYPRGMWLIALYLSCWTLGKSINTSIATIEPI